MPSEITIVDYQMGNLRSVQKAIERVGGRAEVTSDPHRILNADKLILPGVGAFGDAMRELASRGLVDAIRTYAERERPFLGICLGLQLLFDLGMEGGEQAGLGIVPGRVIRFEIPEPLKIPHMGWNQAIIKKQTPLVDSSASTTPYFYFVHSYYAVPKNADDIWLEADYGGPFCAAIQRGNLFATQFHPEKSQREGLQLLQRFNAL